MFKKFLLSFIVLFFSASILLVSIFRSTKINFEFNEKNIVSDNSMPLNVVNYELPFPGKVGINSPFWSIKVVRDKLWILITLDKKDKANIYLHLSDKRLAMAINLIEDKDYNNAVETAIKAEQYLQKAYDYNEYFTKDDFLKINFSALKHREVLEWMRTKLPEDAKPIVVKHLDISKSIFDLSSQKLRDLGQNPPIDPFLK